MKNYSWLAALFIYLLLTGCGKSEKIAVDEGVKCDQKATVDPSYFCNRKTGQWRPPEEFPCDGWSGSSNGYTQWECDTEKKHWRECTECYESERKTNQEKTDLVNAARTRLLDPEETKRLLEYGPYIFTRNMQTFFQADIEKSFDELLLQQARLKVVAGEKR